MEQQEYLMKALVQVKRMGNLLNEVLDLSQQMAESLDRNDQVAVEMLMAIRREPIDKLEAADQVLREQILDPPSPAEGQRLAALLNRADPETEAEQMLANLLAANARRLAQVIELDKVLNRKLARGKSAYS